MNFHKKETSMEVIESLIKPFSTLEHEWSLVTAGTGLGRSEWNTMTIAWASFGRLWNKNTVAVYVRPTRHTSHFTEANDWLTLSFFDPTVPENKKRLKLCGTVSGKDIDKAEKADLHPVMLKEDRIGFEEATFVLTGRKLYSDVFKEEKFKDTSIIEKCYPIRDFHFVYFCEIDDIFVKNT